ncbi:MAG: hypothetical protein K8I60_04180 [Anaerolineae bacterium]|nr:hypothetical protein [Anaerolineae bacterium]
MDHRELEYHLQHRHQELLREREHDRLADTARTAQPRRPAFFLIRQIIGQGWRWVLLRRPRTAAAPRFQAAPLPENPHPGC